MQRCTLLDYKTKEHLLVCIQTIWDYSPALAGGKRKGAGAGQRLKPNQQSCSADTKGPSFVAQLYCTNPQHLRIWWHHLTVFHGDENRKPLPTVFSQLQGRDHMQKNRISFSLTLHHFLSLPACPHLSLFSTSHSQYFQSLALTSSIVRSSGIYLSQLEEEISLLQAVRHGHTS